ncbi:MAG: DNA polymerase III subunit gamma/tau [Candidatus Berkelbacteria bacterium]|nr:DNA polymerase III subunit gamma/tau [Candidatus Berkelbacteria bacterium]
MAFYQKYRAKTFGEMVGQKHVVLTLLNSIKADRLVHAYLLTGPRGIGKTSTARLLAKAINCEKTVEARKNKTEYSGEPCNECENCIAINEGRAIDVIEIDAASHTGVDDVRDLIEKAKLQPTRMSKKVYIIDEVHMLSKSAFNALLKTLEEPPLHVVFILATTESHKIPATILSRAQRYDFRRADKADLIENLKRVAVAEKIEIDDASLELIALSAAGGHRDALSLLEQVSSQKGDKVTSDITREILGIAETLSVIKFVGAIFDNFPEEGLKIAHELFDKGFDMSEFNRRVIETLRQILIAEVTGKSSEDLPKDDRAEIKALSQKADRDTILRMIDIFVQSGKMLKDVAYPVLPIEIALIEATAGESVKPQPVNVQANSGQVVVSKSVSRSAAAVLESPIPETTKKEAAVPVMDEPVQVSEDSLAQECIESVPVPVKFQRRKILISWRKLLAI